MTRKPKLTSVERLLEKARKNPSPTCNDPRQLSIEDSIKQRAFDKLDRAIKAALEGKS
jgi:hypothetical protein